MGTKFKNVNDMEAAVGQSLGTSDWIIVSQKMIDEFAKTTMDEQWIHIDVERAKRESPYKKTIAHGYLILSLLPRLLQETYKIEEASMGINYGTDKVRFTNATPAGAYIRASTELMSFEKIENGAKIKMKAIVEIKGQTKPACIAELIALVFD